MQNRPHTSVQYKLNKGKLGQGGIIPSDDPSSNYSNNNNILNNNTNANNQMKTKSPVKQHFNQQNQNSYSLTSNNSSNST